MSAGINHIELNIGGSGLISKFLWGLLKGFNRKHTLDSFTTNEGSATTFFHYEEI